MPENRQEITTEGGLDVVSERDRLGKALPAFAEKGDLVFDWDAHAKKS